MSACAQAGSPNVSPSRLVPPFDVAKQRAEFGHPSHGFVCPQMPEPVQSLQGQFFYTDKKGSTFDVEAYKKAQQLEAPARTYTKRLGEIADVYLSSNPPDPAIQNCALSWLQAWAKACGLCGPMDSNSETYRAWALPPIATAYLIVTNGGNLVPAGFDDKAIRSWIGTLATAVLDWVPRNRIFNNLSYWAASGAILASVVDQNRTFFDSAVKLAERGIDTITPEGTLPGEMGRGQRAYEYHQFALLPLSILAKTAEVNGVDLFGRNQHALRRAAERMAASAYDPSFFVQATGIKQSVTIPPPPAPIGDWAWAEIILSQENIPTLEAVIKPVKPLRNDRGGGDLTLLYGKP